MESAKNIILVGFMGAGKTTVARELAKQLGLTCIDLDAEIAAGAGCSIPEIFANDGEAHFRLLETYALERLQGMHGLVVATGGGIVEKPENWDLMRKLGVIVHLAADWEILRRRLAQGSGRPLADPQALERTHSLFQRRQSLYAQADWEIDSGRCAPADTVSVLAARLRDAKGAAWNACE